MGLDLTRELSVPTSSTLMGRPLCFGSWFMKQWVKHIGNNQGYKGANPSYNHGFNPLTWLGLNVQVQCVPPGVARPMMPTANTKTLGDIW